MTEFAYELELDVRYRDLDTNGHVNNAVYATYCEQTHLEYFLHELGISKENAPTVLAHLELDYRRPVSGITTVTVAASVVDIGSSSFTTEYEIREDDELVATGETTRVVLDGETEESRPVPDEWRERIEAYEGREF